MKTFRAKKAEVPLANFLQRHQLDLTQSSIFMWRFRFTAVVAASWTPYWVYPWHAMTIVQ